MVTCEICGREFKNTQGLSGHMRFFHGNGSSSNTPATPVVTEPQSSKLEERLEKLEYATGLRKVSMALSLYGRRRRMLKLLRQSWLPN
jgi:hypothetical protein